MSLTDFGRRVADSTRGRIVAHLRRGASTVDELARAVGTTDNAVRSHLIALERDGMVRQEGVRRGTGVGKPATLYDLHPGAEPLLSRAYPPVLAAVLDVIIEELPPKRADEVLREVGRRLAGSLGGAAEGDLRERVAAAAAALVHLGGDVEVIDDYEGLTIRGYGCPLSAAVACRPEVCRAVETLVSEIAGASAHECCDHGERPRCCFSVDSDDKRK
jgi:predicted ArsR family transcriptional regulator